MIDVQRYLYMSERYCRIVLRSVLLKHHYHVQLASAPAAAEGDAADGLLGAASGGWWAVVTASSDDRTFSVVLPMLGTTSAISFCRRGPWPACKWPNNATLITCSAPNPHVD